MSNATEPIIKLEENGKAAILSYNVPEPTSYSGNVFIELDVDNAYFTANAKAIPKGAKEPQTIKPELIGSAPFFVEPARIQLATNQSTPPPPNQDAIADFTKKRNQIAETVIGNSIKEGKHRINIYKDIAGKFKYELYEPPAASTPSIMLVEKYRLNSFLGNYGAGRVLNTFSLLPGEETTISISTYKKTESTTKKASCILDSVSETAAEDIENTMRAEYSREDASSETAKHQVNLSAEATFCKCVSVKASYGYTNETNQQRKEAVKNINNAVNKHASKASAERKCEVNTTDEIKEQTGEETTIKRTIKNINVSRTLNFVFRQMNQEFITLLCLTDVRLAFFNGFKESYYEVPLYEIDSFLNTYVVGKHVQKIKNKIFEELKVIIDYENVPRLFVTQEDPLRNQDPELIPRKNFLRVKENLTSTYKDVTGNEITVAGIIMNAQKNTLRTDGIIVEALLGAANALDEYSTNLQMEAIREKELKNELLTKELEKVTLLLEIVKQKDTEKAALVKDVFGSNSECTIDEILKRFLNK